MSVPFGPYTTSLRPVYPSDVTVTAWDGAPVTLASPVTLTSDKRVSFAVSTAGRYKIRVTRYPDISSDTVTISNDPTYDPSDPRSYVDKKVSEVGAGDVSGAIEDYFTSNPPLSIEDVEGVVADYASENPSLPQRQTTTLTAANGDGTVALGGTTRILSIESSAAARFRLYRSAAQRTADAARAFGTLPVGDAVLADHDFGAAEKQWTNQMYSIARDGSVFYYSVTGGPVDVTIIWQEVGA